MANAHAAPPYQRLLFLHGKLERDAHQARTRALAGIVDGGENCWVATHLCVALKHEAGSECEAMQCLPCFTYKCQNNVALCKVHAVNDGVAACVGKSRQLLWGVPRSSPVPGETVVPDVALGTKATFSGREPTKLAKSRRAATRPPNASSSMKRTGWCSKRSVSVQRGVRCKL